jgi:hypothetical protein
LLLKGYLNSKIEGSSTSQIIEDEKSFIGIYSQKENLFLKFKRRIVLDFIVAPTDFDVDEKYIYIITPFINKNHLYSQESHILIFDHDGILLQKTGLELGFYKNKRFLVSDYETIYCADLDFNTFYKLKFSLV